MSDKEQDQQMVMNEGNADGVLLVSRKLAPGKARTFLEREITRKGIELQKPVKVFGLETERGVALACQFLDKIGLPHIPVDTLLNGFWADFDVECQDVNKRHQMTEEAERKVKAKQQTQGGPGGGDDSQGKSGSAPSTPKTPAK